MTKHVSYGCHTLEAGDLMKQPYRTVLKSIAKITISTLLIYIAFISFYVIRHVKKSSFEQDLKFYIDFDYGDLYDNTDQIQVKPVRNALQP